MTRSGHGTAVEPVPSEVLGPIEPDAAAVAFWAFESFVKAIPTESFCDDGLYARAQSLTEELETALSAARPNALAETARPTGSDAD